jgi:hypothetical protein
MLKRFSRFNPLRIGRALDAVQRLEAAAPAVRQEQKEMGRQLRELTRAAEDLQKSLAALDARLDRSDRRIEQCIAAYTADAMSAERMSRVASRLDAARARWHAAESVARARLEMDPGAHIVIEDLLPEESADELVKAVPPSLFFPSSNMKRQEIGVPFFFAPRYNRTVWDFFAGVLEDTILPAVVEKFRPALDEFMRKNWPGLGSFAESGVRLGVMNSRIMLRRPGYRIKPHRDPRWAFLTCLVYLQKRDDPYAYGTQFYRLHQERDPTHHSALWLADDEVAFVKEVPARRNSAVVFLNSTGAHGAFVPSDAPAEVERFIYQVQFGPDEATRRMLIERLEGAAQAGWTTARGGY